MHPAPAELAHALQGDVRDAAVALLGSYLIRGERRARIVEVEAYRGLDDPGSHAFRGETPRTKVMFGKAGLAYVYFTYGMHWMLNVVAQAEGEAAAVLVRAAEPIAGIDEMRLLRPKAARDTDLLSGPAGKDNGLNLLDHRSSLHIEPGHRVKHVLVGTRIGLAEGKGEHTLWRYGDPDAIRWISKPLTFGHPVEAPAIYQR
jgi:DNA-3-methyladenine glycosylase